MKQEETKAGKHSIKKWGTGLSWAEAGGEENERRKRPLYCILSQELYYDKKRNMARIPCLTIRNANPGNYITRVLWNDLHNRLKAGTFPWQVPVCQHDLVVTLWEVPVIVLSEAEISKRSVKDHRQSHPCLFLTLTDLIFSLVKFIVTYTLINLLATSSFIVMSRLLNLTHMTRPLMRIPVIQGRSCLVNRFLSCKYSLSLELTPTDQTPLISFEKQHHQFLLQLPFK